MTHGGDETSPPWLEIIHRLRSTSYPKKDEHQNFIFHYHVKQENVIPQYFFSPKCNLNRKGGTTIDTQLQKYNHSDAPSALRSNHHIEDVSHFLFMPPICSLLYLNKIGINDTEKTRCRVTGFPRSSLIVEIMSAATFNRIPPQNITISSVWSGINLSVLTIQKWGVKSTQIDTLVCFGLTLVTAPLKNTTLS